MDNVAIHNALIELLLCFTFYRTHFNSSLRRLDRRGVESLEEIEYIIMGELVVRI